MDANDNAIVIRNVVKSFKRRTIGREYTTLKSELVRFLTRQRSKQQDRSALIESLRGIDLVVPRGKTMGILGRNGSGKSTLLKLITGIYSPTSGTIEVNGRISALLDLGAGFHPDFSGRENILINGIILGMSRAEVRARMDEIIAFSELGDFIDEPVRNYSSGMYMRLAFSVATFVDPEILIIDEILAVGDVHFTKKSFAKMNEFKQSGKTILLVTHDMHTVERWCDMAAWIDGGRIRKVGTPAEVVDEYRRAVALAEERSQSFVPPAMSPDGGALPEVNLTPQAPPVEISAVRLRDGRGAESEVVDTEDPLEVEIDFRTQGGVSDAGFEVSFTSKDGTQVYGTSTFVEGVQLPSPLPLTGSLRFRLARLGFTAGAYSVLVMARRREGEGISGAGISRAFTVQSAVADWGLVRPPHQWSVDPVSPTESLSTEPVAHARVS
ncbi:ABC transporter ATP-binding protein [Archangium violaceum]|uniref:ABC transporter ATP-binding protein n=1 Tax=Archangium violaceum TaxID=83451 RepID=UPI002B2A42D0|nr:ABC transporter ATP-binding protein [Archangium violaceum]